MVLHGESSIVSDIAKEDAVEYKTKTKTEILSDKDVLRIDKILDFCDVP